MKKNKIYKLALFGNPVSHSLSPVIHQQFANQFNLSIDYQLIQVDEKELASVINDFFNEGGYGANVTLPHKITALSIVNKTSKIAKEAHAVNTLSLNSQSQLIGDNTDGIGFINDLVNRCHFTCKDKSILILGAGGATQGIVPAIMLQNPKKVVVANRTLSKATSLCTHENSEGVTFAQLDQLNETFDLIVHSSSLGHHGKTLEFSQQHKHFKTMAYDLSYAKAAQPFIQFSQSMGLTSIFDGLGMLVEQAASAFETWFAVKPKTDSVFKVLSKEIHTDQQ